MFTKQEKSRFTNRSELASIATSIEALRSKKNDLKYYADNGTVGSIDYRKYVILERLVAGFDKLIENYNKNAKPGRSRDEELDDMTGLIIDMNLLIVKLNDKEMEVIGTPRDNQRRNVNQWFHYGAMGTGVVVGTMRGGPLLGVGLLCSSNVASRITRNQTGINNVTPKSALIVIELVRNLCETFKGITSYFEDKKIHLAGDYKEIVWFKAEEMDAQDILAENLYLLVTDTSIEALSKDKSGNVRRTILPSECFDTSELQQIKEGKSISKRHQAILVWATIKGMHAFHVNEACEVVNSIGFK